MVISVRAKNQREKSFRLLWCLNDASGISLIIFVGIIAQEPAAMAQFFASGRSGAISPAVIVGVILMVIATIMFVVFMERALRKIHIQYPRRQVGMKVYDGGQSHLPIKLNPAGVIPAIFASSILLFPASIAQWFGSSGSADWLQDLAVAIGPGQPLNILLFTVFIVFFCFFYTALMFNPQEVADNLKRSGAFVPGIRPGQVQTRCIDCPECRSPR